MDELEKEWMGEWMDELEKEWMDEWIDGRVREWVDEWIDGRVGELGLPKRTILYIVPVRITFITPRYRR